MLAKATFKKNPQGIFLNQTPPKKVTYQKCIETRNALDMKFYTQRMGIIHDTLLPILRPLIGTVKARKETLKVIDVGCGDGVVLSAFSTLQSEYPDTAFDLYGLDVDTHVLRQLPKAIHKVAASAMNIPFPKNTFDIVTCSQAIEHVSLSDAKKMVRETFRVLKPGGMCYFETPNPESLIARAMGDQWWMYIDLHLILLPPKQIGDLFQANGFTDVHAGSRAEIDAQIDEAREIHSRLKNLGFFAKILGKLNTETQYKFLAWIITALPIGGITTLVARKPLSPPQ